MTDRQKDASIDHILKQGLVIPPSLWQRVREILSMLGFGFIFWDMSYSICFTIPTLVITLLSLLFVPERFSYSAAAGIAPMLFLLITFFAETSERISGLYELKQTCRYTVRQITAVRVMCYAAAGILFTGVVAAIMADTVNEFFMLLPICLSMLFICAAVQLSALRLVRNGWAVAVISACWAAANLAVCLVVGEWWESFLRSVPIAIGMMAAVLSAVILVLQIKKMLMEANQYAIA